MVGPADKMPKRYKVLITGSSGMLGADLSVELRRDYEVTGADLLNSPWSAVSGFHRGDIADKAAIAKIISEIKPDAVVHAAAWTDVDGCELNRDKAHSVNAEGARNVALACKASGALMVYISTDFVFDGRKEKQYSERDAASPISVYGHSKLEGEEAVKKSLKRYFILRTSWLYGRRGKNFVNTIISKARTEKALRVVDDQAGSPTYTKDLASAIHKLLDKALGAGSLSERAYGTYHVSNSGKVSWYDYAREILAISGSKAKVVPMSSAELERPAKRPAMSVMDNTKFRRITGYRMRPWKTALKEYLLKG